MWPSPGLPMRTAFAAHFADDRLKPRPHIGVAADKRGELAFLRLLRRAAERRVAERNAARLKLRGERHGRGRIGCRAIDDDHALLRAGFQSVGAPHQRFHLGRAGDAEKYDVGILRDLGRALCFLGAALDQILDRRAIAVAHDRERMAFLEKVLRHAVAHKANADKSDAFGHLRFPFFKRRRAGRRSNSRPIPSPRRSSPRRSARRRRRRG